MDRHIIDDKIPPPPYTEEEIDRWFAGYEKSFNISSAKSMIMKFNDSGERSQRIVESLWKCKQSNRWVLIRKVAMLTIILALFVMIAFFGNWVGGFFVDVYFKTYS